MTTKIWRKTNHKDIFQNACFFKQCINICKKILGYYVLAKFLTWRLVWILQPVVWEQFLANWGCMYNCTCVQLLVDFRGYKEKSPWKPKTHYSRSGVFLCGTILICGTSDNAYIEVLFSKPKLSGFENFLLQYLCLIEISQGSNGFWKSLGRQVVWESHGNTDHARVRPLFLTEMYYIKHCIYPWCS